jgi:hypothetical protein
MCSSAAALATWSLAAEAEAELIHKVDSYRQSHEIAIVGALDSLTRFRSVAADSSGIAAAASHLERSAEGARFRDRAAARAGLDARRVWLARGRGREAHGRVLRALRRSAGDAFGWASDPFVPIMRSGPLASREPPIGWKHARAPLNPEWRLLDARSPTTRPPSSASSPRSMR